MPGARAQTCRAVFPAPDIPQVGNARPRATSRSTCRIGGTHCGIDFQLGAAKHSSTRQPSTARAGVGARSAAVRRELAAADPNVSKGSVWRCERLDSAASCAGRVLDERMPMTCLTVLAPPDDGFGYQHVGRCEVNVGLCWGISDAGFGLFSSNRKGIKGPDSSESGRSCHRRQLTILAGVEVTWRTLIALDKRLLAIEQVSLILSLKLLVPSADLGRRCDVPVAP